MEKQKNEKNEKFQSLIILIASLTLGIIFNYFFVDQPVGISFFLYTLLILTILIILSKTLGKNLNKKDLILSIPLIFFSAMVFVRSSTLLIFLNIVTSLFILLLIAKTSFQKPLKKFLASDYVKTIFLPFKFILPLGQTISKLFSSSTSKKNNLPQIIRGILITIPILAIFLLLFSSADLIFEKYISEIINIHITPETIARILVILVVTLIFTGAYSYIFTKEKEEQNKISKEISLGHIELSILLSSINILFLIFIIIQLTYLFGGEQNISSQGFTYSQYARRGFFELIAVAVISFLLIFFTDKYKEKNQTEHKKIFKYLSSILIIQVMIIMYSAIVRLSLYEQAYGLTTLRMYSHAFIFLLVIIFCLLLYKIHKQTTEETFSLQLFISVLLFLASMNIINPDAFIANYNIKNAEAINKLDTDYICYLSDDAIPYSIKILDSQDEVNKRNFASCLYQKTLKRKRTSNWQSYNISHSKAQKLLDERKQELEKYKDYLPLQKMEITTQEE